MQVIDLNNCKHDLQSLYQNRRVVCAFLRHLGCRFCWQMVNSLNEIQPILQKHDIQLICISSGTLKQAKQFVQDNNFKGEFFLEINENKSSFSIYQNFKLLQETDFQKAFQNPLFIKQALNAEQKGFQDHPFYAEEKEEWAQDISQLGGVFVLGTGNTCDYAYRCSYLGDQPDVSQVLQAAIQVESTGDEYVNGTTQKWYKILNVNQKNERRSRKHFSKIFYFGLLCLSCFFIEFKYVFLLISLLCLLMAYNLTDKQEKQETIQLDLYTPKVIDKFLIENNKLQCDCSHEMSKIEMQNQIEVKQVKPDSPVKSNKKSSKNLQNNSLEYEKILCYLREFLAKPNPFIGRKGPTCPFVPSALKLNSLYLSVISTGQYTSKKQIKNIVEKAKDQFAQLSPTDERQKVYKTIILIFPDIHQNDAPELIDDVQQELKASFIEKGLMIGEFHMGNNNSGLRNPNFYPLRTPYPCLAIRHMVSTDIAFMTPKQCDKSVKIQFLEGYIKNFNGDLNRQSEIDQAVQLLNELKQEQ